MNNNETLSVAELEKKLSKAKEKESQKVWDEYLNETEEYLRSLVGKTFVRHHSSYSFGIFKVKGYIPQYYIDRNGMDGSWSPSRWFELTCSAMINCHVSDQKGRYYRPHVRYIDITFNLIKKKSIKTEPLDYINYDSENYACVPDEIKEFGKLSYKEGKPDYIRDWNNFSVCLREAPPGMWEAAKDLADQNIIATKKFWDIYQPIVRTL